MKFNEVFLFGSRAAHHATHSGYEGFSRFASCKTLSPVPFRWLKSKWGWKLDTRVARMTGRPLYSFGLLLAELLGGAHMLVNRHAAYHAIYGDLDLWLLPKIAKTCKVPLFATFHEPADILEWLGIERQLRGLTAVVLVSRSQRDYFKKFPLERVFVIPHGVDSEYFQPIIGGLARDPVCITVGSHLRDFPTLYEAMNYVWRELPNVKLVAIGTNHHSSNGRLSVEDPRVTYLSNLSDAALLNCYQCSRLAIFSFRGMTASNALLEAMATGLPVIATRIGGVEEYTGDSALLCNPKDPRAMAGHILAVLQQPALAETMALKSRERAQSFDFRRIAQMMDELYRELSDSALNTS